MQAARNRTVLLLALIALMCPLARGQGQATTAAKAAAQSAPAERIKRDGVPNLGRVSHQLFRGGQPEGDGYDALKQLGVTMVVNLRDTDRDKPAPDEQQQVESRGMRYVSIPWTGYASPDNTKIVEFLKLLRENPEQKVFVHCRRGAERTGVMVASYRITEQGWTAEQALDEMEDFKFRGFWFRHLKKYVRSYPELLKTDATLSTLLVPKQPVEASAP